jgi:hypothetical protein
MHVQVMRQKSGRIIVPPNRRGFCCGHSKCRTIVRATAKIDLVTAPPFDR